GGLVPGDCAPCNVKSSVGNGRKSPEEPARPALAAGQPAPPRPGNKPRNRPRRIPWPPLDRDPPRRAHIGSTRIRYIQAPGKPGLSVPGCLRTQRIAAIPCFSAWLGLLISRVPSLRLLVVRTGLGGSYAVPGRPEQLHSTVRSPESTRSVR